MKELEIFKLEERVLFEAAAAAEVVDAVEKAQENPNANISESERSEKENRDALKNAPAENPAAQQSEGSSQALPEEITDVDAALSHLIEGVVPAGENTLDADENGMVDAVVEDKGVTLSTGKELVVINSTVADKEVIFAELKPNQEVLVLEDGSGLDELNEFLDESDTKYSAIHFITHGNDGYISVNGELIDAENFNAAPWQEIGEHLTAEGDILLYGCSTAETAEGQQLIDLIAQASGADVAASTDSTGISGNWELEYAIGDVTTAEITVENFEHNLTNYTVTNLNDSGTGSLRQAVTDANANAGTDEITFTVNGTIQLNSALFISDSVEIQGNGADKTIVSGGNFRTFSIDPNVFFKISDVSIINGSFQNNGSGITYGGSAIYNKGIAIIENCNISQNCVLGNSYTSPWDYREAHVLGGAIYNHSSGEIHITNSLLANNTAKAYGYYAFAYGSAIYNNNGKVTINNSTLSGNLAVAQTYCSNPANGAFYETAQGGSIYNTGSSSALVIANSTVVNNALQVTVNRERCISASGTAIYSDNFAPVVVNSIIAGNSLQTSTAARANSIGGVAALLVSSIYDSADNSPASGSTGNHLTTESGFSVSSMFGSSPALADKGGHTQTLALQSGANQTVKSGGVWVTRYLDSSGAVKGVGYASTQSGSPELLWGSATSTLSLKQLTSGCLNAVQALQSEPIIILQFRKRHLLLSLPLLMW